MINSSPEPDRVFRFALPLSKAMAAVRGVASVHGPHICPISAECIAFSALKSLMVARDRLPDRS